MQAKPFAPFPLSKTHCKILGLSAGTGKLCIFGHLGLVFIWNCFVSCLLLLLYYVICAPVLTEGPKSLSTWEVLSRVFEHVVELIVLGNHIYKTKFLVN